MNLLTIPLPQETLVINLDQVTNIQIDELANQLSVYYVTGGATIRNLTTEQTLMIKGTFVPPAPPQATKDNVVSLVPVPVPPVQ